MKCFIKKYNNIMFSEDSFNDLLIDKVLMQGHL